MNDANDRAGTNTWTALSPATIDATNAAHDSATAAAWFGAANRPVAANRNVTPNARRNAVLAANSRVFITVLSVRGSCPGYAGASGSGQLEPTRSREGTEPPDSAATSGHGFASPP